MVVGPNGEGEHLIRRAEQPGDPHERPAVHSPDQRFLQEAPEPLRDAGPVLFLRQLSGRTALSRKKESRHGRQLRRQGSPSSGTASTTSST